MTNTELDIFNKTDKETELELFKDTTQGGGLTPIIVLAQFMSKPVQDQLVRPGEFYLYNDNTPISKLTGKAPKEGFAEISVVPIVWQPFAMHIQSGSLIASTSDPNSQAFKDIRQKDLSRVSDEMNQYIHGPKWLLYLPELHMCATFLFAKTNRQNSFLPDEQGQGFKLVSQLVSRKNFQWYITNKVSTPALITELDSKFESKAEFLEHIKPDVEAFQGTGTPSVPSVPSAPETQDDFER